MLNTNQNNMNTNFELSQRFKERRVFDQFLQKPQKVTPDNPRGYLVKENLAEQFGSAITDTIHDVDNLGKALRDGKRKDAPLGRINDLGMKLGGGLIAAALMGARQTPNKKLMEVCGFATFFSAMSLWPKVMIDLPTKLRHGFNPHQKYVDSHGVKKEFFLDNQYLPWDLWSKEDINKVADKMNVPRDMPDREEYTKEKMRTIALQDNTLWMLTAGFATPLLASLFCNRIEEGTRVPIANASLLKLSDEADGVTGFTGEIKSCAGNSFESLKTRIAGTKPGKVLFEKLNIKPSGMFAAQDAEFAQLTAALKNGKMPENFAEKLGDIFDITKFAQNEQISKNMTKSGYQSALDLITRLFPESGNYDEFVNALCGNDSEAKELFKTAYADAKKADIKTTVERAAKSITSNPDKYKGKEWAAKIEEGFDGLPRNLRKIAESGNYDEFVNALCGNDSEAKELFKWSRARTTDIRSIIDGVNELIYRDPDKYKGKEWAAKIEEGFDGLPRNLRKIAESNSGGCSRETMVSGAEKLEEIYTQGIKPAQTRMNTLGIQIKKLDGISGEKYNSTAKAMLDALDLSDKELKLLRNSNEVTNDTLQSVLTQKIKEIAADDTRYHKTMKKLAKEQSRFESVTNPRTGSRVTIKGVFDKLTGRTGKALEDLADIIDTDGSLDGSSLKKMLKKGISENEAARMKTNITSVDSMITKLIGSIELERKIADGTLLKDWAVYAEKNGLAGDIASMSADECENFYNLCRKLSWQTSYGDIMNKFRITGNGGFFKAITQTLFSGKAGTVETRNWQDAVRSIALETDNCVTNSALEPKIIKEVLPKTTKDLIGQYAKEHKIKVDDVPKSVVNDLERKAKEMLDITEMYSKEAAKSHNLKFADFGESVLNTLKKQIDQTYTDKKWMTIFGGATAALVGVTLISQLFFGKVKDANLYGRKDQSDSFERQ